MNTKLNLYSYKKVLPIISLCYKSLTVDIYLWLTLKIEFIYKFLVDNISSYYYIKVSFPHLNMGVEIQ